MCGKEFGAALNPQVTASVPNAVNASYSPPPPPTHTQPGPLWDSDSRVELPSSTDAKPPTCKMSLRDADCSSLENRQLESWRRLFVCHRQCCKMLSHVL